MTSTTTEVPAIDPAEVERIAEGLSAEQRRIMEGSRDWIGGVEITANYWLACALDKLVALGLLTVGRDIFSTYATTPLGRAVAAALAAKAGAR